MTLPVRTLVGTVQFHGWSGWLPGASTNGERFARLGQSTSGSQATGTSAPEKACTAWIGCMNQSDAIAAIAAVEALAWQTVKVVDQWGEPPRALARVRVTAASAELQKGKGTNVAGTAAMLYLVRCALTLEVLP